MKRHEGNSGDAVTADFGLLCPIVRRADKGPKRRNGTRGQALVELALAVPMALLLIVLAMNFGGLINAWIAVANAARAAADYAILSGSSAGLPIQATSTTLQNLINADLSALPNLGASNPHACVRQNNNGTYTTIMEMPSGACTDSTLNYANPPSDGEAINASTNYINLAVDITYTYTVFFSGTTFLGYRIPGLPSSVHERWVMRIQ